MSKEKLNVRSKDKGKGGASAKPTIDTLSQRLDELIDFVNSKYSEMLDTDNLTDQEFNELFSDVDAQFNSLREEQASEKSLLERYEALVHNVHIEHLAPLSKENTVSEEEFLE